MNSAYTDKTFLKVDRINTHVETQVIVSWAYDDFPQENKDFDFGDPKENAEYLKRFGPNGDLLCIFIKVTCTAEGESGTDKVGMCVVKASDLETEIRNIVAEYDMKNNACIELRENILNTAKRMTKYVNQLEK